MHNRAWQVLGCLPSDRRVEVKERLLGLLPPSSGEGCEASAEARAKQAARLAALQKLLEEHLDIDALRAVAARAAVPPAPPAPAPPAPAPPAPAPAPAPTRPAAAGDRVCVRYDGADWYVAAVTAATPAPQTLSLRFEDGTTEAGVAFPDGDEVVLLGAGCDAAVPWHARAAPRDLVDATLRERFAGFGVFAGRVVSVEEPAGKTPRATLLWSDGATTTWGLPRVRRILAREAKRPLGA
jgi:hypothetical protein